MIRKKIPWMILFVVIAGFSIWAVMSQSNSFSMAALKEVLLNIKIPWLILAILSMSGFIFFEGFALRALTEGLCNRNSLRSATVYGAADVYFSAITPSASGGQPASAFFMMRDGIPPAVTTVILLVNLIMYTFALLFCAVIVILLNGRIFFAFDIPGKILILVGVVVLILLANTFFLLLRKEALIKRILSFAIDLGEKLHIIRHPDVKRVQLDHTITHYRECSNAVAGKSVMLAKAFFYNLIQRLSLSMVTVFSYLAIGGNIKNWFLVWSIQIMTTLGSNSVPIPGAMGVHDYLLLQGLAFVDDVSSAANLELISRGLSFYICVAVSVLVVIIGYFMGKKKKDN